MKINVIHPEVCPNCGIQLVPHLNDIKATDELEVKRLIFENEPLSKVTEGVYKKDNCPHYYNLLKNVNIGADIIIICFEDATAWLHLYKEVLYKYELSAIAAHCIGVMAK
ncbi:MAG TPA: hypothetical protein VHT34_09995 [Clostridia bacterium]|nr:hypothetical protein [Clostridia bacterium]